MVTDNTVNPIKQIKQAYIYIQQDQGNLNEWVNIDAFRIEVKRMENYTCTNSIGNLRASKIGGGGGRLRQRQTSSCTIF